MSRRSVRSFENQEIDKKTLEAIVKAGMAAPTAVNSQPWRIIATTDKGLQKRLAEELPYADMAQEAGAVLTVCGEISNGITKDYWVQDCSAMTENMLLTIHSLGLGAVWTGVYPDEEKEATVRRILEIPDEIRILAVIPLGVPRDKGRVKNKWDSKKIHWQKW